MRKEIKLFGKFSLVGILNTCLGYLFISFFMLLGKSPYLSNAIGYGLGFVVSFILNKRFVFSSEQRTLPEVIKFFAAAIIAYSLNFFGLHLALSFQINPYVSQVFGIALYASLTYLSLRFWVFCDSF